MKRNRAELAPSKASEFPAKAQRRYKDPTPKGTARVRAPPPEKPRQGGGAEKRSAAAVAVDSSGPAPAPAVAVAVAQEEERPLGWDDFGGWWWWGAEEEMLLGWFPFVEEDFSSQENMGGSGLFWEEEDYDIWQLQHIHEIPNQAK